MAQTTAAKSLSLAPGARVLIRDEEWTVRSVKAASHGGQAVHVAGVSELVSGQDAIFLTELDPVVELRPEETRLVADTTPRYRRSRLYLDSLLRRTPPTDSALYVGHRAAIDRADYQLQPAVKALAQPRPRILMADGVGLGKTIEVGILLSELIQRGRADRILVVALKSILAQFQLELWARFTIPLVRLDSVGIQRVQSRIPTNMNPFYYFDRVIISIDTLKKDEKYRRYLEDSRWDVVVVDECQNVAIRGGGGASQHSQRARLARLLSGTSDALILTSATPHDGRPESFASLMRLLEPTAIADDSDYASEEVSDLFLRRFKKDVAHEVRDAFHDRVQHLHREKASAEEDLAFAALAAIEFRTIAREKRGKGKGILFRTLLLKAFLSSPAACAATIRNRLAHKALAGDDPGARHDREALERLLALVLAVTPEASAKYRRLLALVRAAGLAEKKSRERVVVFTERIDTLEFLAGRLRQDLDLDEREVAVFHGTLDDQAQQGLVQSFGVAASPIRILVASDAAAEGLNLHYHCHRLVHYDLPWSLITLEQRNGRIDRYGQKQPPEITYLLTLPGDPKLAGDLRVLERLIAKEAEAHKNLGDVAWLLALHDQVLEEEHIAAGIEEGKAPEEVVPDVPAPTDFMTMLFGSGRAPRPEARDPLRLFGDDLEYAREGFAEVLDDAETHVEWHDHLKGFSLSPPPDLLRRFDYLPAELRQDGLTLKLTSDRQRVKDALEEARKAEGRWPEWQLFWELHPVAEWLADRVLASYGRHEAPVLRLAHGVAPGARLFLFQGVVSNRRSQPVLVDWFAVRFDGGGAATIVALEQLVPETRLDRPTANPGGSLPASLEDELKALLPRAVDLAREHMKALRRDRSEALARPLREGLGKLARFRERSQARLAKKGREIGAAAGGLRAAHEKRLADERKHIEHLYEERRKWVDEGIRTVEEPYLRLAAVLAPLESA